MMPMDDGLSYGASGPTEIFRALFTNDTASQIAVVDYTPDIGSSCLSLYHINNAYKTISGNAPDSVVDPSDVLLTQLLYRGPIFNSTVDTSQPYSITINGFNFAAGAIPICSRIPSTPTNNAFPGLAVRISPTFINLRVNGVSAGTNFSGTINTTDTIVITDDGTNTIDAIKIYRNDILLCSNNTVAATGSGPCIGISFANAGQSLSEIHVFQ